MVEARNVFDSEEEFNRLRDTIMAAIDDFSDSRGGNVTYGEIMFVLESIVESFRQRCEGPDDDQTPESLSGITRLSQLRAVLGKTLELLVEKGIVSREEETHILSGK